MTPQERVRNKVIEAHRAHMRELCVTECPYCGGTGPFSVQCRAWMVFEDGEPVRQDARDIPYATPVVGEEAICQKCQGTWTVGEDEQWKELAERMRQRRAERGAEC